MLHKLSRFLLVSGVAGVLIVMLIYVASAALAPSVLETEQIPNLVSISGVPIPDLSEDGSIPLSEPPLIIEENTCGEVIAKVFNLWQPGYADYACQCNWSLRRVDTSGTCGSECVQVYLQNNNVGFCTDSHTCDGLPGENPRSCGSCPAGYGQASLGPGVQSRCIDCSWCNTCPTPLPTSTRRPVTNTPIPGPTYTPTNTATFTPIPPTHTPIFTNTPVATATNTPGPVPQNTNTPQPKDNEQPTQSSGLQAPTCPSMVQSVEIVDPSDKVDILRFLIDYDGGSANIENELILTDDKKLDVDGQGGISGWGSMSPNLCYMVFQHQTDADSPTNLWIVSVSGPKWGLWSITNKAPAKECAAYPQWVQPNEIVYTNTCDGYVYQTDLYGTTHKRLDSQLEYLAVSPDSSRLAGNSSEGNVNVWDFSEDQVSLPIDGHAVWYPDGTKFYVFPENTTVRTLDMVTGELMQTGGWQDVTFDPREIPQYLLVETDQQILLLPSETSTHPEVLFDGTSQDTEYTNPGWWVAKGLHTQIQNPGFSAVASLIEKLKAESAANQPTSIPAPTQTTAPKPTSTPTQEIALVDAGTLDAQTQEAQEFSQASLEKTSWIFLYVVGGVGVIFLFWLLKTIRYLIRSRKKS